MADTKKVTSSYSKKSEKDTLPSKTPVSEKKKESEPSSSIPKNDFVADSSSNKSKSGASEVKGKTSSETTTKKADASKTDGETKKTGLKAEDSKSSKPTEAAKKTESGSAKSLKDSDTGKKVEPVPKDFRKSDLNKDPKELNVSQKTSKDAPKDASTASSSVKDAADKKPSVKKKDDSEKIAAADSKKSTSSTKVESGSTKAAAEDEDGPKVDWGVKLKKANVSAQDKAKESAPADDDAGKKYTSVALKKVATPEEKAVLESLKKMETVEPAKKYGKSATTKAEAQMNGPTDHAKPKSSVDSKSDVSKNSDPAVAKKTASKADPAKKTEVSESKKKDIDDAKSAKAKETSKVTTDGVAASAKSSTDKPKEKSAASSTKAAESSSSSAAKKPDAKLDSKKKDKPPEFSVNPETSKASKKDADEDEPKSKFSDADLAARYAKYFDKDKPKQKKKPPVIKGTPTRKEAPEAPRVQNPIDDELLGDVMSDADLEAALDNFATGATSSDVSELLKTMNENAIIQWDEAQRLLNDTQKVIKCGLPEQQRPSEPENATDVERCIEKLLANDPIMTDVNINNMKRTPIPLIQKLVRSMNDNNYILKLSMANVGLQDMQLTPCLFDMLESNTSLLAINLETNFLTGDFILKMFQALLKNQCVEEVRVANQGIVMGNQTEMDIADAIEENYSLRKVGLNFRRHEARNAIDRALYRNNEMRRVMRLEDAKFEQQTRRK